MLVVLAVTLLAISAVFFILTFSKDIPKREQEETIPPLLYLPNAVKEPPARRKSARSGIRMILCAILFVCNLAAIVFFALRNPSEKPEAAASPAPALSAAPAEPAAQEVMFPSETPDILHAKWIVWFDDLKPYTDYQNNFCIGGWNDQTPFLVGERNYTHGVGMYICGTANEISVDAEESPDGIFLRDCKQTSIAYALRRKYSKLVFSLGVDAGDARYYGPKETNGRGRVILSDISHGGKKPLMDTGWCDYTYTAYEAEVPLENVELLEITVMACGYDGKRVTEGLRFAIVDPILYLKDGS